MTWYLNFEIDFVIVIINGILYICPHNNISYFLDLLNLDVCQICDCHRGDTDIDCSKRNFNQIPESLPMDLVSLNLHGNNISRVGRHALYGCEHIRRLDLSGNGLIHIDPDAFSSALNLTELNLHDNMLDFNSSESYNMFKPMKQSLKILSIQNNTAYSDRIFGNLISLKNLSIESDDDFGRGL